MDSVKNRPAFTIVIEPDPASGGFVATVPSVSGVSASGKTEEEALRLLKVDLASVFGSFESRADPESLAKEQGVSTADFEALLGDFWPESEAPQEFAEALARWREEPDGNAH